MCLCWLCGSMAWCCEWCCLLALQLYKLCETLQEDCELLLRKERSVKGSHAHALSKLRTTLAFSMVTQWSVRPALGGPGALNKEEEKEKARGEPQGAIVALLTLQAKRETTGLQEPNKTSETLQSCSGHVQK
ncbi:uncharacterized [Tachysurus ichikawai]